MHAGESFTIGSYTLRFQGLDENDTPHLESATALRRGAARRRPRDHPDGAGEALLQTPAAARDQSRNPLDAVADLYVVLAGIDDNGQTATFEVFLTPLVFWLWAGGLLMVLGTVIVMWPNVRERTAIARRTQPTADPATRELRRRR